MISHWFGRDKPAEYYLPDLHGQIFTLPEIRSIVAARGLPEDDWQTNLPDYLAPYIEAQVWRHDRLHDYWKGLAEKGLEPPSCDLAKPASGNIRASKFPLTG